MQKQSKDSHMATGYASNEAFLSEFKRGEYRHESNRAGTGFLHAGGLTYVPRNAPRKYGLTTEKFTVKAYPASFEETGDASKTEAFLVGA